MDYKGKKCVFKLNGFELEVEEIENRDKIYIDEIDSLWSGIFADGIKEKEEVPKILKGRAFEDNSKEIVFNIRRGEKTSARTYSFTLDSYTIFKKDESSFDTLRINSEELNWFYNVNNAYKYDEIVNTGQILFELVPLKDLKKSFEFNLGDELVSAELNIIKKISTPSTSPIELATALYLSFKETTDYSKIHKLINVTSNFLKFVTYRRNISVSHVILIKTDEKTGNLIPVGEFYPNREEPNFIEKEKTLKKVLIDLPIIEKNIGALFNKIQNNMIYLTHIPENSVEKSTMTPARFVMITAGFEWQFRKSYEELNIESEKEKKRNEGLKEVLAFLDQKIEESTGAKRKYFKGLKDRTRNTDMGLSPKINWALNEFKDVLDLFINHIYKLNHYEDVKYSDIGDRIQNRRNDYAHGNIDKKLKREVLIDLTVLEWLYYAMVLSSIGMSRENIKAAIDKLFSRGYGLSW